MNKYIKYGLLLAIAGLLGYKSVYFEKLSTKKNAASAAFDAAAFCKKLLAEQMPAKLDSAVALTELINAVASNPSAAFNKYSNALAVGNYRYALVKAEGVVTDVKEDEVMIDVTAGDSVLHIRVATEFVYGNAVRDASGLVQVKDYPNTADLSSISEALNKIIRTDVLPSFKTAVKKGNNISVVAAVELNKEHIHWQGLELLPVRIIIKP
jgi:predicted lipoprotein